ncbi:MAG: hypothetical protein AB1726_00145 [Planctomycetota bacterium]
MEQKDVEVTCPCCGTRITVDVRTRHILRSRPPERTDDTGRPVVDKTDWDRVSARVEGRLGAAKEKFENGLAKERTREQDLDDLFRRASEKAKEQKGPEDEEEA